MNTHRLATREAAQGSRVRVSALWLRDRRVLAGLGALVACLLLYAAWSAISEARAGASGGLLTHEVRPMDLRVTALENGTLESASSIPVLSGVEGQVAIISLVPQGTRVEKGDVVVELESSGLRTRHTEQKIAVERARAAHGLAQQKFVVATSQKESDLQNAELALEFAELDLKKYLEGDYPLDLRTLQTDTALAEEELERARARLEVTEDLQRDGFLGQAELEADRFRAQRNQYLVEIAKERERQLQEYTFPRTRRELESKVTEARRARERAATLAQANLDQARTNLEAEEKALKLEVSKLAHIEEQIERCTMLAPQAGVVVYPVPEDDDAVELFIKQGAVVRQRQHVFSIPDTDVLQVSTSIHEAMVEQIQSGMRARIWVDVHPDVELRGEVKSVAPLPDPEDWRKTTVKFYETKVALLDPADGLRPGMSAKVEILMDRLENVLALPVQAVVQRGRTGYCYVQNGRKPELRRLRLGKASVEYIAVEEGLSAGELVLLSPDLIGVPADLLQDDAGAITEDQALAEAESVRNGAGATAQEPAEPVLETEYEAILTSPSGALAEAEYEIQTQGDVVTHEFEVKIQKGLPGATWSVAVDGEVIGSVSLDELGNGEVQWSTKDLNFPANFPSAAGPGTAILVGDDLQGVLAAKS
jgi:HlyD family secretion protein